MIERKLYEATIAYKDGTVEDISLFAKDGDEALDSAFSAGSSLHENREITNVGATKVDNDNDS